MTLRHTLRRAIWQLPPAVQMALKETRALVRQNDWAYHVRDLRRREDDEIRDTIARQRRRPGRRRVLVFSLQQSPPWLEISYGLAVALQLRGHDVRGLLCDGVLPICEMNLGAQDRPPCDVCSRWLARYEEAFGFAFGRLTELLSPSDRLEADALVARMPPEHLELMEIEGVAVGRFAHRELQRYRRGFVFDLASDPAYRAWLVAGVLLVRLAGRLLDRERPDTVMTSSGRTLSAACLIDVARARGLRVVTWDTEPSHPDGLVFSHNGPAVEIPLDEAWAAVSCESLTAPQRRELMTFLDRWSRSENTPFPYNVTPLEDRHVIRSQLGLRSGAPLIVAFANCAWDMAVVDRDVGFTSMFDWLFDLVEYAIAHPEMDLVVRAHPAEVKVPDDLRSRTPVAVEIRNKYRQLPSNIKLVEGDRPISSYVLADMAQAAIVYASRLGLEIALGGKKPWIAGDVTYRGKGFTRDLQCKEDMTSLLDARTFDETLLPGEILLAERFAYLWFFRYVTKLPLLRPVSGRFRLETFRDLAEGGNGVVDRLCEAVVSGAPFIDLNPCAS